MLEKALTLSKVKNVIFSMIGVAAFLWSGVSSGADVANSSLLGKWRIINEQLDQAALAIVWEFTANEIIVRDERTGAEISRTRYTIDATKSPHWITAEIDDSPNAKIW